MKTKIIEWNINQRLNFSGQDMPEWIADEIAEKEAGIVALTEVYRKNNWEKIKEKAFGKNYAVFESANNLAGQNDVAIGIDVTKFEVKYARTFFPNLDKVPDYLEVKLKSKNTSEEFVFACTRIRSLTTEKKYDIIKLNELKFVLKLMDSEEKAIICGDFNNFRRGCPDREWNMNELYRICHDYHFVVKTPTGSSIYEVNENNVPYQFAEDHFLLKGINTYFELLPYYRDFVKRDKNVYKWGKDFQRYMGIDKNGEKKYEKILCPYPDHAILEAIIDI